MGRTIRKQPFSETQALTFGEQLRSLRLARGLSQREVANALGVDASYISRIETGKIPPPPGLTDRLKDVLSLSQDQYIHLLKLLQPEPEREKVLIGPLQIPTELLQTQALLSGLFSPRMIRQLVVDPEEKNALGHFLSTELIELCDPRKQNPIILDSGTTCAFVAYHLRITAPHGLLDVYTSNLLASLYLVEKARVYLLGGRVDTEFGATFGSETVEQLSSLLSYLNRLPPEQANRPVAILACLAFTPSVGPYARKQDLPNSRRIQTHEVSDGAAGRSRHMEIKARLISSLPDLVLPLTSEKLIRSELPAWQPIAAPIDSEGHKEWQTRLAGIRPNNARTHVVLSLPTTGLGRERVIDAVNSMLNDPVYPFTLVQTLFGRVEEGSGSSRFLTVFDMQRYRALSFDELKRVGVQSGIAIGER